jgi:peptide chain release factor 3
VSCDDRKMMGDFERSSAGAQLAHDAAGNLAFLSTSGVNLKLTQERWPGVTFHTTREHAVKVG